MDTTLMSDIDMSNFTSITDRPVNTNCEYILLPNLPEMKSRIDDWQKTVSNSYYKNNSRNEEIKYKKDSCVCKVFTTFNRWSIHIDINQDVCIVGEIYQGQQLKTLPITMRISDKIVQDSSGLVYNLNTPDFRANTISESMKSVFINGFPQDWQKMIKLEHSRVNTPRNSDSGNYSITRKTKQYENLSSSDSEIFLKPVVSRRKNTVQKKSSFSSSVHKIPDARNVTFIQSNDVRINKKLNYSVKSYSSFDESSDSGNDEIIKKQTIQNHCIITNGDKYNSMEKSILNTTKTNNSKINLTPFNKKPLIDTESDYSDNDETIKTKTIPKNRMNKNNYTNNKKLNYSHSTFISIFDETSDSDNDETIKRETITNQYKSGNKNNSTKNSVSNKTKINNSQKNITSSNKKPSKNIESDSDNGETIKKQVIPNQCVNTNEDKNNSMKSNDANITKINSSKKNITSSNRKSFKDIEIDNNSNIDETTKKKPTSNYHESTNGEKNNKNIKCSNKSQTQFVSILDESSGYSDIDDNTKKKIKANDCKDSVDIRKYSSFLDENDVKTNSSRNLRLSHKKLPKNIECDSDNGDKNNSMKNNVTNNTKINNSQKNITLSNRKSFKNIKSDNISNIDETTKKKSISNYHESTNGEKNNKNVNSSNENQTQFVSVLDESSECSDIDDNIKKKINAKDCKDTVDIILNDNDVKTNSSRNLRSSHNKPPKDIESNSDNEETVDKQDLSNHCVNTNGNKINSTKKNVSNIKKINNSKKNITSSNKKLLKDIESDSDNGETIKKQVIPNQCINTNGDENNSTKKNVLNIKKIKNSQKNITSSNKKLLKDIEIDDNSNIDETTKKKSISNYHENTNREKNNKNIICSNESQTQFVSVLDEPNGYSDIDDNINDNDVKTNSSRNLRLSNRKPPKDIKNDSDNGETVKKHVVPNNCINTNGYKNNSMKNKVSNITKINNIQRNITPSNRKPLKDIESDNNSKKNAKNGKTEIITDIPNKKDNNNRKGKKGSNKELQNVSNLYDSLPSNKLKSMAEESKNQHLLSLSESIYVSRRGRTVYPPLKYWLGESVDVINDETVYIPGNVELYEEVDPMKNVSKTKNNRETVHLNRRSKCDKKVVISKNKNKKSLPVKKNGIPEVIRINKTEIENKKRDFENDSSDNNKTNFKRKRKLFSQNNSFSYGESLRDSEERHMQIIDSFKAGNGQMFVTKNQDKPGGSIAFTDFSLVSNV